MHVVAFPSDTDVNLDPPDREEAEFISRGLAWASCARGELTELQRVVLEAVSESMTGYEIGFASLEPVTAQVFAEGLWRRDEAFRTGLVQLMELSHMILPEASVEVADRVIEFAEAMSVSSDGVEKARQVADGSKQLIAADFDRSSYISNLDLSAFTTLSSADENVWAWTNTVDKADLTAQWRALGDLAPGTLGRSVHSFYQARGFRFPGSVGSAPPLLAQHDWVHVIADFGSTVESELEVFAFIACASDNPESFTLLAMTLNLFHTGNLDGAAGLFQAAPGHLGDTGMPVRLANAMRRGVLCEGSIDFLAVDWFAMADWPVDDVRAHFGVVPKSAAAVAAGSPGPWEPGGISEFQVSAGQKMAAEESRAWDAYGAST